MKLLYSVIFFSIFFNISAFMMANTGFFPNGLYGDLTGNAWDTDMEDPNTLPTSESVIDNLFRNAGGNALSIYGVNLTFGMITAGIVGLIIAIAILGRGNMTILAVLVVAVMFYFMYWNSKSSLEHITSNLDANVQYIVLMAGIGMLIMVIITILDYASGQSTAGGKSH